MTDSHRPGVTDFVHIELVVEDLGETASNSPSCSEASMEYCFVLSDLALRGA